MPHGYPSKALSYFEDCLELFPVGADSLLAAGSAQELMGSIDGLVPVPASPRGGRRLGPHLPEALPRFEERQRQAMQRALRAAEEHYRRAIQLEPGLAEAHLRLGRVLQRRNRAKQARSELSWVIENSTHNQLLALAQLFLGELEKNREQWDEAIRLFRLALWAEPESQAAWLALSQALHRSGEMPASAEAARVVLVRTESGDSWLAYHLAFPNRARAVMERLRGEVRR
jgi:tetratricopeptide (TPR) repeat protein